MSTIEYIISIYKSKLNFIIQVLSRTTLNEKKSMDDYMELAIGCIIDMSSLFNDQKTLDQLSDDDLTDFNICEKVLKNSLNGMMTILMPI